MIKSFIFENFKSFKNAELSIEELTVLIGSNSSGKTNAIEGMKILSEISTGRDFSIILDGSKNVDSDIRGGSRGCASFSSNHFLLGCIVKDAGVQLCYKVKIRVDNRIYVEDESLMRMDDNGNKDLIFKTKTAPKASDDIKVEYDDGNREMNSDVTCVRYSGILAQISPKMNGAPSVIQENIRCIELVVKNLRNILFLNPIPSAMRDYSRMNDAELRPNAENISAVLEHLCQADENKSKILELIQSLPENEVLDIEFVRTAIGDVIFALKEKYGKTPIEVKRLSDGTIRCMAIITALISGKSGSMVVIEEVDNGIHPSRAENLILAISQLAQQKNIDVLITTHNPALLNALPTERLIGVSICYRDRENGNSQFISLLDIEDYPKLLAEARLGDLSTKGELLRAIKRDRSRQNISLDWLGI